MRDDALPDGPGPVPKKRRQLQAALDVQLALWLDGDLTPSERRRVQAEKDERKRRRAVEEVVVGLVVAREGMPRPQRASLEYVLRDMKPTAVHHCGDGLLHRLAYFAGAESVRHDHAGAAAEKIIDRAVVQSSQVVIAAPRHAREPERGEPGVWDAIRYARHRSVPVKIVLPDGSLIEGEQ